MKCPNCGMDIVIATHLCPHCGYAHDFDGSIEPRREIPEPWEITQEKSRKRREKRERAASTWARSRAGRGAQEAAYVRDDRVREQDAVKHGSADEDVPERLWTFTRNLVLASLILCAALLFAASAFYLTGAYFELDGRYTSSYAYWMLPELRLLDTIFGAACIPIALTVITAFAQLRRGKRSGRGMLVFAAVLFCIVRFAYDVALTAAFDLGSELLSSIGDWLIPVVLYVVFVQLIIRKNPAFNVGTGT